MVMLVISCLSMENLPGKPSASKWYFLQRKRRKTDIGPLVRESFGNLSPFLSPILLAFHHTLHPLGTNSN